MIFNPTIAALTNENAVDLIQLTSMGYGSGYGEDQNISSNLSRISDRSGYAYKDFTPYPLSIGADQYLAITASGNSFYSENVPYFSLYKLDTQGNLIELIKNSPTIQGYFGQWSNNVPYTIEYVSNSNRIQFITSSINQDSPNLFWVDYFLDLTKLTPHEGYFSINYSGTISTSGTNIDLSLSNNLQGLTPKVITLRRPTQNICTWTYNNQSLQGAFSPRINNLMIYTDRTVDLGRNNKSGNILYGTMNVGNDYNYHWINFNLGAVIRLEDITINASGNIYRIKPEADGNSNLTNVSISGRYCDVTFYT